MSLPKAVKRGQPAQGVLADMALKAMVWEWMEQNGARMLTAEFNGEGDSGSFEEYVTVLFHNPHSGEEWEHPTAEQERVAKEFAENKLTVLIDEQGNQRSLADAVRDLSEKVESDTDHGVDWWNNEGGRGEVNWILDGKGPDGLHYRRGLCLTVEARVIEYEATHIAVTGDEEGEGSEPNEEAAAS